MADEKAKANAYLATLGRVEPEIAMINPETFYASAAINLKRIADALDAKNKLTAREMHTQEVADEDRHDDWLTRRRLGDLIEDDERREAARKRVMPTGEPDAKA